MVRPSADHGAVGNLKDDPATIASDGADEDVSEIFRDGNAAEVSDVGDGGEGAEGHKGGAFRRGLQSPGGRHIMRGMQNQSGAEKSAGRPAGSLPSGFLFVIFGAVLILALSTVVFVLALGYKKQAEQYQHEQRLDRGLRFHLDEAAQLIAACERALVSSQQGVRDFVNQRTNVVLLWMTQMVTQYPDAAEGYLYRGRAYALRGELAKAEADLNQYIEKTKGRQSLGHYYRGVILAQRLLRGMLAGASDSELQGLRDGAREDFRIVKGWWLKVVPDADLASTELIKPWVATAFEAYLEGRYESAANSFNMCLAYDSTAWLLQCFESICYMAMQEARHAETLAQHAVKLSPHTPETRMLHGTLQLKLNETDRAEAEFREALELDAGFTEAAYGLALVHLQRGEWDRAVEEFGGVLERGLATAGVYLGRARAHAGAKRAGEALKDLQEAAKRSPTSGEAAVERARIYLVIGRPEEAEREATAVLSTDSNHLDARLLRAEAFLLMKQKARAHDDVQKAAALNREKNLNRGGEIEALRLRVQALPD